MSTSFIKSQLEAVYEVVNDWSSIIIAYEPIWAIGTGKVATPRNLSPMPLILPNTFRTSARGSCWDSCLAQESIGTWALQEFADHSSVGRKCCRFYQDHLRRKREWKECKRAQWRYFPASGLVWLIFSHRHRRFSCWRRLYSPSSSLLTSSS